MIHDIVMPHVLGNPIVVFTGTKKDVTIPQAELVCWHERAISRFRKMGLKPPVTLQELKVFLLSHQLIKETEQPKIYSEHIPFPEDTLPNLSSDFVEQLRAFRTYRWYIPRIFELLETFEDNNPVYLSLSYLYKYLKLPKSWEVEHFVRQESLQKLFRISCSNGVVEIAYRNSEFPTDVFCDEETKLRLMELAYHNEAALFTVDAKTLKRKGLDVSELFQVSRRSGMFLIEGDESWDGESSRYFIEIA